MEEVVEVVNEITNADILQQLQLISDQLEMIYGAAKSICVYTWGLLAWKVLDHCRRKVARKGGLDV